MKKRCLYKKNGRIVVMRSSWEVAYANYLDDKNIRWFYEPYCFFVGKGPWKGKGYCPDFFLPDQNKLVEVKGLWLCGAQAKVKSFRQQYPNIVLEVLRENDLVKLGCIKRWRK